MSFLLKLAEASKVALKTWNSSSLMFLKVILLCRSLWKSIPLLSNVQFYYALDNKEIYSFRSISVTFQLKLAEASNIALANMNFKYFYVVQVNFTL